MHTYYFAIEFNADLPYVCVCVCAQLYSRSNCVATGHAFISNRAAMVIHSYRMVIEAYSQHKSPNENSKSEEHLRTLYM